MPCYGMLQFFGLVENDAKKPSSADFMDLLSKKEFNNALKLTLTDEDISREPYCLSSAITNGASVEFVQALREKYRLTLEHFLKAIDIVARIGSVHHYKELRRNALDFEGLTSKNLAEASISASIDAAAGGFFHLLYTMIEDNLRQKAYIEILAESADHSPQTKVRHDQYRGMSDLNKEANQPVKATPQHPKTKEWLTTHAFKGKDGYTQPLHAAVDWNRFDVATLLLLNNADPELVDYNKDTPCSIAKQRGLKQMDHMLSLFCRYRNTVYKIKKREKGHPYLIKLIKACPALASRFLQDESGFTLFHYVLLDKDYQLAKVLLEREPRLIKAVLEGTVRSSELTKDTKDAIKRQNLLAQLIEYAYSIKVQE